jgi:hypothetical protein
MKTITSAEAQGAEVSDKIADCILACFYDTRRSDWKLGFNAYLTSLLPLAFHLGKTAKQNTDSDLAPIRESVSSAKEMMIYTPILLLQ